MAAPRKANPARKTFPWESKDTLFRKNRGKPKRRNKAKRGGGRK